ncbi:MAG: hypothetical protein JKX71_12845 [Amylibacter sp.]|nr:hypothetical protein [Amylibacter sp.]
MPSIIKYRKIIADDTTYQLFEPDYADGADRCVELATIEGDTYVAVPATVTLPAQPTQIIVKKVTMNAAIKAKIKATSPHVRLINERVVSKIREKYSDSDEIKMLWQPAGPAVDAYRTYVATCVAEGLAYKAALGL